MRRGGYAALLVVALVGCGHRSDRLDASVAKRLAVAKASTSPAYWLGPTFDGLKLVHVDSGNDAFFKSELYYADCSWLEATTTSPRCHRSTEVDNDVPTRGEISTMGRCIFSTTIQGVTVATFPVNPEMLRVFSRTATVMVGAARRSEALHAIAALEPLNGHPLEHRDVSAVLGSCKAPPPKPPVHLNAKQRYEQRMKAAWFIESIGSVSTLSDFDTAAKPRAVLRDFIAQLRPEPLLLRNEADRIARIKPPAAVADLQSRLVAELWSYAAALSETLADAQRDGLAARAWARDRKLLQPRLTAAQSALVHTVQTFTSRRYSIYVKPTD